MKESETKIPNLILDYPTKWVDYELLDSGDGMKLERYGQYILSRPEAEAIWSPKLSSQKWNMADLVFEPGSEEHGGHWLQNKKMPESWKISYGNLKFVVKTSASRHVGLFPEQASQWDWIQDVVRNSRRQLKILNLFGYTGAATLAAASAGAQVTHIDASKKSIAWARENQTLSGLDEKSVRWIVEDALKFVRREEKRQSFYDGIILDPPKFGRGPKGEVWEFYKLIPNLLGACKNILSKKPELFLMTTYSVKASPLTLAYAVEEMLGEDSGLLEAGEVGLLEKSADRLLSTAVFVRWSAN